VYYRYSQGSGVDRGYPRPLGAWKNVRRPVDAALRHGGTTFFLSGTGYQVFDDKVFRVGVVQLLMSGE